MLLKGSLDLTSSLCVGFFVLGPFPMRVIDSTYFVDIIQPTLNKNQHILKDSRSFVFQAQTWIYEADEIQVSHDVTNLHPSIHIDKAIDLILQQLSEDYDDLKTKTKVTLTDLQQLTEICVSERYFI